jgi:CRISPR system Cascade subunit CasD
MPKFLVFTLAAPLASFGGVAGNQMRGTLDRPGHSLIVGLIGAALGLDRLDPRLEGFSKAIACAVAVEARGAPLRDFHTVQSVPQRARLRPATRREALLQPEPYTTISERDYWTDIVATAAIALFEQSPFSLADIEAAMRAPRFTLYLGRKSCPLALPLTPCILERETINGAMADYRLSKAELTDDLFPAERIESRVAGQRSLFQEHDNRSGRIERRRTLPERRSVWSFGLLEELVLESAPWPKADGT